MFSEEYLVFNEVYMSISVYITTTLKGSTLTLTICKRQLQSQELSLEQEDGNFISYQNLGSRRASI